MMLPRPVPIFGGHNGVLLRPYRRDGTDAPRALTCSQRRDSRQVLRK